MKQNLGVALQAIVDVSVGSVSHYEALARVGVNGGGSGHIALIEWAERYGFISQLDLAMLDLCAEIVGESGLRLAVNVSPATVELNGREVIARLHDMGAMASRMVVEITEMARIHHVDTVATFCDAVRSCGVVVALDDFGAIDGWHDEEVVRAVKPGLLKLDRVLVEKGLVGSAEFEEALVLAEEVGAEVIAEWVDTPEKLALVRERSIRFGQGALFGMPVVYKKQCLVA